MYRINPSSPECVSLIARISLAPPISISWKNMQTLCKNDTYYCSKINSGRKEGNVLFNDALNTFYLRLYGIRHMVKDHSYSERGNPLPPHGLLLPINSKGSFYMHHPTDRIAHTTAFVTPVMEHWLEREIAQWVHHEGSIRRPIAPYQFWMHHKIN